MIVSAAQLFRERGIQGTAFSDVLEHSGAPRGSVYHHFPDGKDELAEEATRFAGEYIAAGLVAALQQRDATKALKQFAASWLDALKASDFAAGCPVVAAAMEGDRTPTARDAAGKAFASWESLLADSFHERGVPRNRAKSLATLAIATIEGAIVLCRAEQSARPFERATSELYPLIAAAIEGT